MLRDPGTLWHTVVGEQILRSGELPRVDEFTFTRGGQPWIAQQWLAEIAMALLHRAGGLDALLLASVCLLAALFAWLFGRLTRAGIATPIAAVLIALVIAASSFHFLVRPHLLTIAFSALLYAMLCDHAHAPFALGRADRGADARRSSRRLWLLVPLMWVWSNAHGGALGGLLTLAAAAILEFGNRKSEIRIRLWIVAAACLLTPLANPYGLELPRAWIELMQLKLVPRLIQEHAPPSLAAPETWMMAMLAVAYVVALWRAEPASRRPVYYLPLLWLALSCMRIRHAPIFAVMVPIALADLRSFSAGSAGVRRLVRPIDWNRFTIAKTAFATIACGLAIQFAGLRVPLLGAEWARLDPNYWPTRAVATLQTELAARPDQPNVFNETLFGGFLAYHTPAARTFIDDRCELLGDDGLLQYARLARNPDDLRLLLESQRVRLALLMPGSAFDRWFARQPGWKCTHADHAARLYARDAYSLPITAISAANSSDTTRSSVSARPKTSPPARISATPAPR